MKTLKFITIRVLPTSRFTTTNSVLSFMTVLLLDTSLAVCKLLLPAVALPSASLDHFHSHLKPCPILSYPSLFGRWTVSVQESPADARVTRESAVIPRWPSAAILDIIEPEIAPFDPTTPKTLALNQTSSGSDAPFSRYSPLNYTVTLKWGSGSL